MHLLSSSLSCFKVHKCSEVCCTTNNCEIREQKSTTVSLAAFEAAWEDNLECPGLSASSEEVSHAFLVVLGTLPSPLYFFLHEPLHRPYKSHCLQSTAASCRPRTTCKLQFLLLKKKGKHEKNKKRKRKQGRTAPIFMRLFLFLNLPSFGLDTHQDFKARKHPET